MRLWSVHPKHLDCKGLVALWRETLLAKHVLEGKTKGYKNHPQLVRFKKYPIELINTYLYTIYEEAKLRGYNFDINKIGKIINYKCIIPVTNGQMLFEISHLKNKVKNRDPKWYETMGEEFLPNPIFCVTEGDIESWEKV